MENNKEYKKILLRRGKESDLPNLEEGEPGYTTDTNKLYIGGKDGNVPLAKEEDVQEKFNSVDSQLAQTVDEVRKATKNHATRKPVFAIIDDDGHINAFTKLKPLLGSKGVKLTSAVATSFTDVNSNFMTSEQIIELKEQGHEIVNHCHTNVRLAELTEPEIRSEFETSQNILKSLGIDTKVLVYPNGSYNQLVVDVAKDYFDVAVDDDSGRNSYPLATYSIKRIGVGQWGNKDWQTIKNLIDGAIDNNELGILMLHAQYFDQDQALIEQAVDYILSRGVEIKTFSEAYNEHKNLLEFGRFDVAKNCSEYVVDIDGELSIDGVKYNQSYTYMYENVRADSPPSAYKKGITLKIYQDSEANTLPNNNGGTVITFIVNPTNHRYNFQLYKPYGNNTHYIRTGLSGSEWSAWRGSGQSDSSLVMNPNISADSPPSAYDIGVTIKLYTNDEAIGLPNDNGGVVTTVTVTKGDYRYNYQEYKAYGNPTRYIRTALSAYEWSAWLKYVQE